MKKYNWLSWTALILLIIGGLNWGLAIWGINIVSMIFGAGTMLTNIIYALVGLSAIYEIYYVSMKKKM